MTRLSFGQILAGSMRAARRHLGVRRDVSKPCTGHLAQASWHSHGSMKTGCASPHPACTDPDHGASCPQAGYELRIGSWETPERLSPAHAVARAGDAQVNVCMTIVPSQDPAMLSKRAHETTGEAGGAQQGPRPSGVVWEAAAHIQPDRA